MKYFKIKNLTNTFKKRDARANTALDITYIDKMVKKNKKIFPDEILFLELLALPLSIHRMRINGLVTVSEISKDEFLSEQKKSSPKKVVKPEVKEKPKTTIRETKSTGKKYGGKKKEDEKKEVDEKESDNTNE